MKRGSGVTWGPTGDAKIAPIQRRQQQTSTFLRLLEHNVVQHVIGFVEAQDVFSIIFTCHEAKASTLLRFVQTLRGRFLNSKSLLWCLTTQARELRILDLDHVSHAMAFDSKERHKDWATIFQSLRGLPKLEQIKLEGNELDHKMMKHLSTSLCSFPCPALRELDFSKNRLTAESSRHLSVVMGAGALPAIEILNLRGCLIGKEGARHLSVGLVRCSLLKRLNLGRNQLGLDGIRWISEALRSGSCSELQFLDLSTNRIQDEAAKTLSTIFSKGGCLSLRDFRLNENEITTIGFRVLMASMLESNACTCLRDFRFSDNPHIGEGGVRVLVDGIKKGLVGMLESLDMSNNVAFAMGYLQEGAEEGAATAFQELIDFWSKGSGRRIKLLGLSRCLSRQDFAAFVDAADRGTFPALRKLDVSRNFWVDIKDVVRLVRVMGGERNLFSKLQCLSLSSIARNTRGRYKNPWVGHLLQAIFEGRMPRLESLSLQDSGVKDYHVQAFQRAIICSGIGMRLRRLNLAENSFTLKGVKELCRMLEHGTFSGLKHLNLSTNRITDEGARAVVDALKDRRGAPHLALLDLSFNWFTHYDTFAELTEQAQGNSRRSKLQVLLARF